MISQFAHATATITLSIALLHTSGHAGTPFVPPAECPNGVFPGRRFEAPSYSEQFETFDLNGDGYLDLIMSGGFGDNLLIAFGDGTGRFRSPITLPAGSQIRHFALADFDLEGDVDIAATSEDDATLRVLLGDGNGNFITADHTSTGTRPRLIRAVHVNDDGIIDLVVSFDVPPYLAVHLGKGDGRFSAPAFTNESDRVSDMELRDLDDDGDADLVAVSWWLDSVRVLRNEEATFVLDEVHETSEGPVELAIAELTGDSFVDLAVTNGGFPFSLTIFAGNGQGDFAVREELPLSTAGHSLSAIDIDRNGWTDVVFSSSAATLMLRDEQGDFLPPIEVPAGRNPAVVIPADVDGDGDDDLVIGNSDDEAGNVLMAIDHAQFDAAKVTAVGDQPSSLTAADFNGDGRVDVAVPSAFANDIHVLLGAGNGDFGISQILSTAQDPRAITSGDYNGDGFVDLAVNTNSSGRLALFIGDGSGTFAPGPDRGSSSSYSLFSGDFDADGRDEIALAAYAVDQVQVYEMTSSGALSQVQTVDAGDTAKGISGGDLTGDCRPELVVSNRADHTVSILTASSGGFFTITDTLPVGLWPVALAVGDLTGDGAPDIVVANEASDSITLIVQDGGGRFRALAEYPVGDFPHCVAIDDFDLNGHNDIVAGSDDGSLVAYLGIGDGAFRKESFVAPHEASHLQPVTLRPLGGASLLMVHFQTDQISISLNQCYGCQGDINGDGMIDGEDLFELIAASFRSCRPQMLPLAEITELLENFGGCP